jgi:hypothetical protein
MIFRPIKINKFFWPNKISIIFSPLWNMCPTIFSPVILFSFQIRIKAQIKLGPTRLQISVNPIYNSTRPNSAHQFHSRFHIRQFNIYIRYMYHYRSSSQQRKSFSLHKSFRLHKSFNLHRYTD